MITQDGPRPALEAVAFRIGSAVFGHDRFYHARARLDDFIYDRRFRADTGGLIPLGDLNLDPAAGRHYVAAPPWIFRIAMRHLPIDASRFTFVDLGCGKGRILLLAAKHGFSTLIGVDLSERMLEVARANTDRLKLDGALKLVQTNAAEFAFPETPLVIFMFNPFWRDVMSQVVRNLEMSLARTPREIFIIYYRPAIRGPFDSSGAFQLIAECDMIHPWYAIYRSVNA